MSLGRIIHVELDRARSRLPAELLFPLELHIGLDLVAAEHVALEEEVHVGGERVEFRFPDAMANPYLAYSAIMMAGLDGIQNRIHPGDPMDKNLYDLPPQELVNVPTVCGSLREALVSLQNDRAFLTRGDVFSDDQIDSYVELKWEEVMRRETTPSPVEFDMYYSS